MAILSAIFIVILFDDLWYLYQHFVVTFIALFFVFGYGAKWILIKAIMRVLIFEDLSLAQTRIMTMSSRNWIAWLPKVFLAHLLSTIFKLLKLFVVVHSNLFALITNKFSEWIFRNRNFLFTFYLHETLFQLHFIPSVGHHLRV